MTMSLCFPGLWITGQREYKMGLAVKEGMREMESGEEVELEEEDHRKKGRVIGEGDGEVRVMYGESEGGLEEG